MDIERLKTPKTDYLQKQSISMDSRFVDLKNAGLSTTLNNYGHYIYASYFTLVKYIAS